MILNFKLDDLEAADYVPANKVLPREESFKYWLMQNPGELGAELGINFADDPDDEQPIGPSEKYDIKYINLDTDGIVPTEIQLGESDKGHHSKVIRCFTNLENVDCAIWLAESFRDDFIKTVTEMNSQFLDKSIYLVRFRFLPIANGKYKVIFNTVVGPSPSAKIQKRQSQQDKEDKEVQKKFLEMIQEKSRQVMPGYFDNPPVAHGLLKHYVSDGICYEYSVTSKKVLISLAFVAKHSSTDTEFHKYKNNIYFRYLIDNHGDKIKQDFSHSLGEGKGGVEKKIVHNVNGVGYRSDKSQWGATIDELVEKMQQLISATKDYISELEQIDLNNQEEEVEESEEEHQDNLGDDSIPAI